MKRLFAWMVRAIAGAFLLLLSIISAWTLLSLPVQYNQHAFALPAGLGFGVALVVFSFFPGLRLMRVYIAGHEFVHWLTAKIFRRRTGRLTLGARAGSVEVEHPNIWIVLAPYVVPLFTLVWIGLYGCLRVIAIQAVTPPVQHAVYAGIGITYSHHVVLTANAVSRRQPDFGFYGLWISLPTIVLGNLVILLFALMLVAQQWHQGATLFLERIQILFGAGVQLVRYFLAEIGA